MPTCCPGHSCPFLLGRAPGHGRASGCWSTHNWRTSGCTHVGLPGIKLGCTCTRVLLILESRPGAVASEPRSSCMFSFSGNKLSSRAALPFHTPNSECRSPASLQPAQQLAVTFRFHFLHLTGVLWYLWLALICLSPAPLACPFLPVTYFPTWIVCFSVVGSRHLFTKPGYQHQNPELGHCWASLTTTTDPQRCPSEGARKCDPCVVHCVAA